MAMSMPAPDLAARLALRPAPLLAGLLALALAAPAAAAGSTWTVDDDGPADFPDIATAIASVAPGDTLLVQPGSYAAFTLGKRLQIVGPAAGPRPFVAGRSQVAGTAHVLLAGLSLESLTLWGCPGPLVVDDCALGPLDVLDGDSALEVVSCTQVLVSRSQLQGGQQTVDRNATSQHGLRAIASDVEAVGCTIAGGAGFDGVFGFIQDGGTGGDGVIVRHGSRVELVDCPAIAGGRTGECAGFVCTDGDAGNGITVMPDGLVIVRGRSTDTVDGGGCYCEPPFYGQPGHALSATAGTAVLSGAVFGTLEPYGIEADGDSLLVQPTVPEPFLALDGGLAPGAAVSLRLHGPAGSLAVLVVATQFGLAPLGSYGAPLWADPATLLLLVPVPLAGQETPVTLTSSLPPVAGLVGLAIPLQAAFPGLPDALAPSKSLLSNPVALVVRF